MLLKKYNIIKTKLGNIYYKNVDSNSNSREFLNDILKLEYNLSDCSIIENNNGKLYLNDNRLYFNISHKKDIVGIAVSDKEIGFDIEYVKSDNIKNRSILKYYFTSDEGKYIGSSNEKLLYVWTKKESYIKMLGLRIADIKNIDISKEDVLFDTTYIDKYIMTICKKR